MFPAHYKFVGLLRAVACMCIQVKGLDLSQPFTPEVRQLLTEAMAAHDLLLFRGGPIAPGDRQRLLQLFPHDPEIIKQQRFANNFFQPRVKSHPLFAIRGNDIDLDEHEGASREELAKLKPTGQPFDKSLVWHMDLSDRPCPPEVSAMYMVITPEQGGETLFASTVVGFEKLDSATQEQLLRLRTISYSGNDVQGKTVMTVDGSRRLDDIDESIELAKKNGMHKEWAQNPLVIQDPSTGRRSLLFSVQRVHHFEPGMSRAASLDLLQRLVQRITAEPEVFTLEWQPHDFAVWANRRILHSATPTDRYKGQPRMFHLVFLECTTPLLAAGNC